MISPFNPEYQEAVVVTPTGKTKQIGTGICRGYDLAIEYEKESYTGTAWIEKTTGAPLLLTLEMETLPRFLDFMTMRFYYTFSDGGTWYASKIEMEGAGTILFQKKRFHSETILMDHFKYSPPAGTR